MIPQDFAHPNEVVDKLVGVLGCTVGVGGAGKGGSGQELCGPHMVGKPLGAWDRLTRDPKGPAQVPTPASKRRRLARSPALPFRSQKSKTLLKPHWKTLRALF